MPKKNSSRKAQLTYEERCALADAKEAVRKIRADRKQDQRKHTAQKRIATANKRVVKLVQKLQAPAPEQKASSPLPAKQEDPYATETDEDVQFLSVEQAPQPVNEDDIETEVESDN